MAAGDAIVVSLNMKDLIFLAGSQLTAVIVFVLKVERRLTRLETLISSYIKKDAGEE